MCDCEGPFGGRPGFRSSAQPDEYVRLVGERTDEALAARSGCRFGHAQLTIDIFQAPPVDGPSFDFAADKCMESRGQFGGIAGMFTFSLEESGTSGLDGAGGGCGRLGHIRLCCIRLCWGGRLRGLGRGRRTSDKNQDQGIDCSSFQSDLRLG
jgi:hypothetical protein